MEIRDAIEAYNLDRFNSRANVIRYKLQDFYEFLKTRDEWRICEYGQDEKDSKIANLQLHLNKLKLELLHLSRQEVTRVALRMLMVRLTNTLPNTETYSNRLVTSSQLFKKKKDGLKKSS